MIGAEFMSSDPLQVFAGFFNKDYLNERGMFKLPDTRKAPPSNETQPSNYQPNYFYRSSKPDSKIYDL